MYKKTFGLMIAASILALSATGAAAQAPPKGTPWEACKANPAWRWVGTAKTGRCFRKVGVFLRDKGVVKQKPKASKSAVKARVVPKAKPKPAEKT